MFGIKNDSEAGQVQYMESLTRTLLSALVDHPNDLKLHTSVGTGLIMVEATPAKGDSGYLIGRGGKTADALRTILTNIAVREGKRFVLSINDGE